VKAACFSPKAFYANSLTDFTFLLFATEFFNVIHQGTHRRVLSTSSHVDLGLHQALSPSRVHRRLGISLQPLRVEPASPLKPFRAMDHPHWESPHISSSTALSTQSAPFPPAKSKISPFKSIYLKTAVRRRKLSSTFFFHRFWDKPNLNSAAFEANISLGAHISFQSQELLHKIVPPLLSLKRERLCTKQFLSFYSPLLSVI